MRKGSGKKMEQQATVTTENKMGVMPIPKLLITMALPMVVSMLVQALYNIVDSLFIARVSQDAFNALALSFPVQMLMIAVGAGTGVGMNALLSRSLGEKKPEEANHAAVNGIFLCFLSFVAFALFGIFGSRMFFESQIDNRAVVNQGTQYVAICTIGSIGIFMQMAMERILQATGKTIYSMYTQGVGAVVNIILDPILIFGLCGMPKLGVAGAAFATVIGQLIAMCLGIFFNITKNKEISISFRGFRPNGRIIKTIYLVGIPAIVMQAIGSIMVLGINTILLSYSAASKEMAEGAVFVFGAYYKLQSFIFMPVFGLNNGMIPILAYNYGAQHKKRIMDTIKLSVCIAVGIMLLGLLIFQVFPKNLLQILQSSDTNFAVVAQVGVPAFRIISLSFVFAGFCIIILSVFQALGSGFLSLIVSATRQLIIILPVAYVLMKIGGIALVWWAFPVAEIASVSLSILFFRHLYNKKISGIA